MIFPKRRRALLALALCASLPLPALADDGSKCKITVFARLPVVMQGDRASVPVTVNGKETRLWLDSGAFFNTMPKAKAVELGLSVGPPPVDLIVTGIGGEFTAEYAKVRDFGIGAGTLHNMEFIVGGSDSGNGFIGANLLGIVDTEFDFAKGKVMLFRDSGCGHADLAYWAQGMAVGEMKLISAQENDHHIFGELSINGHTLRAMLDTGADTSIVSRRAAERAGIDLASPKVVASMKMSGVGAGSRKSWIARTQTISIGGEEIRNSPIRVIDNGDDWTDHDMLLGMDFFLSHHVLVSQTQRKIYLTYNGGPVFSASTDDEIGAMETRAVGMGKALTETEPTTADQYAGRGSARLSRNDIPGAIADLSAAIKLAPARADLLASRASAYQRGGHPDFAEKDIEAGLVLAPHDHRLLARRARIRLGKSDRDGALADTDAAAAATPKGSLDVMDVVILYERLGKADRGLALLDPVVDLHRDDSSYAELLNARSWNRALANADLDRALRDVNTALRKSGNDPSMLDTRALVQLRRKDYAAAIADANAALDKAPKTSATLFLRGLTRIASGDSKAGQADVDAARALRPKIDQYYAAYGLTAPKSATPAPAQPQATDGDDASDDQ